MSVCFLSSELAPFAKAGGLGDVSAALPRYLHGAGHDVRRFVPLYSRGEGERGEFGPVDFLQDVRAIRCLDTGLAAKHEVGGPENRGALV